MGFQIPGSAARRERQQGPTPEELRLRVEVRTLREKVAAQEDQLENLQRANEHMYRQDYDRAGGPRFSKSQSFGGLEPSRLSEVPFTPGGTS